MNVIDISHLRLRKAKRHEEHLREFDDYYEYCLINDYEMKYDDFKSQSIQISDIFVTLLELKTKTIMVSFLFSKSFDVHEIVEWLDGHQVRFNEKDQIGYYIEHASPDFEGITYKGLPIVVAGRGHEKIYYDINDFQEVTSEYENYSQIVNTSLAKPVEISQNPNSLNIYLVEEDTRTHYTEVFKALIDGHVKPYGDDVYFRPMVCLDTVKIPTVFLIGYNPATPIYKKDLEEDTYVQLLLSYPDFKAYYEDERRKRGKRRSSPTRSRMEKVAERIFNETGEYILETNVYSYPTSSAKDLKKVDEILLRNSQDALIALLYQFSPLVLLVHGKKSLEELLNVLKPLNMVDPDVEAEIGKPIVLYRQYGPNGIIISCNHLSRIGMIQFNEFQQTAIDIINKLLRD